MAPAEIPGFFWDEEKQKYFKILSTGHATASQLGDEETAMQQYTISSVAREKRRKLRSTDDRPPLMAQVPKDLGMVSMAMRLNRQSSLNLQGIEAQRLGNVSSYAKLHAFNDELIHTLAWDDTYGGLYCGASGGTLACLGKSGLLWSVKHEDQVVTSIGFSRQYAATVSVDEDVGSFVNILSRSSSAENHRFKLQGGSMVSSLAMASESVTLGTAYGILGIDAGTGKQVDCLDTQSAILCVDAEASQRIAGCRNGDLFMFDARAPEQRSALPYGSAITHLKYIKDNKLVVCGLEDKMTLYDTRTLKPLFQFKGYYNHSSPFHGFSVDSNQGMVAVAIDDGAIRVYDLFNGDLLASPSTGLSSKPADATIVKALAWNEDNTLFVGDQYTVLSSENKRLPIPKKEFGFQEFELESSRLKAWPILEASSP